MPAGSKPQGDGLAIIFQPHPARANHAGAPPRGQESLLGFVKHTRGPREGETDGKDYHFLTQGLCLQGGGRGFVEHEEVYEGLSYGTLCSEVERCGAMAARRCSMWTWWRPNPQAVFGDSAFPFLSCPVAVALKTARDAERKRGPSRSELSRHNKR